MRTLPIIAWVLVGGAFMTVRPIRAQARQAPLLPVDAIVLDGEAPIEGCSVVLHQDEVRMSTFMTRRKGQFQTGLEHGHLYTLEFSKPGFITKRIVVDTRADVHPSQLPGMPILMDVEMLRTDRYKGIDTDALDMPFAIVRFDKRAREFVQDPGYAQEMHRTTSALLLQAVGGEE
jgi:hypothetical protein